MAPLSVPDPVEATDPSLRTPNLPRDMGSAGGVEAAPGVTTPWMDLRGVTSRTPKLGLRVFSSHSTPVGGPLEEATMLS